MLVVFVPSLGTRAMAHDLEVRGWLPDNSRFVWITSESNRSPVNQGRLLDPLSGQSEDYDLDQQTWPAGSYRGQKSFQAWLDQHPLVLKQGRESADGKASVEVEGPGDWSDGLYVFPAAKDPDAERERNVSVYIRRGKERWLALVRRTAGLAGALSFYWSPDGRRLAAHMALQSCSTQPCERYHEMVLVTGQQPRIIVIGDSSVFGGPDASPSVLNALDKLGPSPTMGVRLRSGEARRKSCVYFAPGFEAEAKKAAAVIPGGASTEALSKLDKKQRDWQGDYEQFDLVVDVGLTALPKP
jgi:hypothetical protein